MLYLLTNELYLYLLIHQNEFKKINYSQLAKETGKTRQTLSKYYNVLLEEDIISEDEIGRIIVNDFLNLSEEELQLIKDNLSKYPAYYIAYLIVKQRNPYKTDEEICNLLNISYRSLRICRRDIKNEQEDNIIYAIIQNKEIKYVGSTSHLENRIENHCLKRNFLTEKDFIILEKCDKIHRFDRESFYRKLFQPEWNEVI